MEIALKAQEERIKKLKQDYGGMAEVFLNFDMVITELRGCYYQKLQNIMNLHLNSVDNEKYFALYTKNWRPRDDLNVRPTA